MPLANVRGVNINYKVLGDHGPWVALSPGGRRDLGGVEPLAKGVADAGHRQVRDRLEGLLDRVGERLLVAAHRLDVHEGLGQGDDIGGEVQWHAGNLVIHATGVVTGGQRRGGP